ncbi:MAG: ABC transporter ATP-binding protein, partial [Oscillospiraceae bacterium]|nr:ABC transporter ATP-binding protein [Oscillospiraceae bacterium]
TNHLDIASREWIEDAVEDYSGALLFVSHDRWFIERFANRIWALADGEITDYRGSFSQFRDYRARQQALRQAETRKEEKKPKAPPEPKPGAPGKKPNPKLLARLEREIERTEAQLAALDAEQERHASDYQKLLELGAQREALDAELEALYLRWEELSE